MAAGAGFWNVMAKNYAKSPVSDEAAYQKKLKKTRDLFRPDMDVLEIGCGTGSTALVHAPYVNSYEGVDFSKKMLSFANSKLKASGLKNLTFTCMPIDDISRENASVDMVLAMSIIHLLPNHKEVLKSVFTLLKPGGNFVSSTVCLGEMGGIVKHLLPLGMALGLLPPIQNFSKESLVALFLEAGFEIEEVWQPDQKGAAVFVIARRPA